LTTPASSKRFCIFCGGVPVDKTKEHVLPYWLLEMTGDPSRVVKLGLNFETQRDIEFSWSSLVMPSCESCNNRYSMLEGEAKGVIEALTRREAISARRYITLLDWLDKVRIGLWLTYHVLQGNPTRIQPTFHIDARIGKKDRWVAVYPVDSGHRGLNAHGVESLLFHRAPSCFSLRVNDLTILNASADFLLAGRCGFPFPKTRTLMLDGAHAGALLLSDFEVTRRIKHPIIRPALHKPSVLLCQPIMQRPADGGEFVGVPAGFDSFFAEHTLPPYLSGKGVLFRQHVDGAEVISDMDQPIDFDSIAGRECRTRAELVAQVYEVQCRLQEALPASAESAEVLRDYRKGMKMLYGLNKRVSKYLRAEGRKVRPA
jgi:hypothetical protein